MKRYTKLIYLIEKFDHYKNNWKKYIDGMEHWSIPKHLLNIDYKEKENYENERDWKKEKKRDWKKRERLPHETGRNQQVSFIKLMIGLF